jgi:2-isopropylmalate synthase
MTRAGTAAPTRDQQADALHLARWTINSGSNVQSRGAVVIASGDHQWEAKAEGNGPVDALYRAVDKALHDVLTGHPRLMAYDVHAVAEGPESDGIVTVSLAPPASAAGARATGRYRGEARSSNIIAASVEAYIAAINRLLAEEHWAGATEDAGNRKRVRGAGARSRRAELDETADDGNITDWFSR